MLTPQEQLQYEIDNDDAALAAQLEQLRKAAREGDITLPRATRFMAAAYEQVRDYFQVIHDSKSRGRGGKLRQWIKALPVEVVSALSIRVVLGHLMTQATRDKACTLQQLAGQLGRAIELEVRVREAEKVNPLYMQRMHEQVKQRGTTDMRHLRRVYMFAYEQVMKDGGESRLSETEWMQIGKFGVDACMQVGIVEQTWGWGNKGRVVTYTLSEEVWEYLRGYDQGDLRFFTDAATRIMLCPPEPWTNLNDGGFYSARRKLSMPLMSLRRIRKEERKRLREAFTAENMPEVFACANYLQSIPMQVHEPTFAAMLRVWQAGGGVPGVPTKEPPKVPEFDLGPDWSKEGATEAELLQFEEWKHRAAATYDEIRRWRTRVRELSGFLRHTQRHGKGVPLWFPVFMDTRGRWYYRGVPNPQGTDLSKAVLHLYRKKPLGKRGVFWLKVSIANHYGYDKVRFAERAAWVDEHWEAIERALDRPEDYPDVFGTDAPWCMYSAAWELREAYRSGDPESYCTGVPVHMDATCSGIQHFSALLRDPVGAKFVNLVDDSFVGPKQDIYGEVAKVAHKAAVADTESTDPVTRTIAAFWAEFGVDRALAKKPVMTYVYGATLRGTTFDILMSLEESGAVLPDSVSRWEVGQYMARKLFQGIAATVPSAEYAMHWLKNVVRSMPKGKRMEWRTPTGFLVQHDYPATDEVRVELRSCGVRTAIVNEMKEGTKALAMLNAIAPNFVHSMDASHLTRIANAMLALGHDMVAIHDSVGTHPCDVDAMHTCIRQEFVRLYTETNVLADFLMDLGIPGEVPLTGSLDMNRVLSSEFFFC